MARQGFRPRGDGGVRARLPPWVRQLLAEQFRALGVTLTTAPAVDDPLEAMFDTDRQPPSDPVLQRLRPDAYAPEVEDGVAALDFRRFTEADLEALQLGRIAVVRDTLAIGDRFELDAAQAQAWLGALNDLRLSLGVRLGVSDDPADAPRFDDPRRGAHDVYDVLGMLQHELLLALGAPDDL